MLPAILIGSFAALVAVAIRLAPAVLGRATGRRTERFLESLAVDEEPAESPEGRSKQAE